MSGSLGEWSIEDLLQIARITHKTTCIEVRGSDSSGQIYVRDGAVVGVFGDDLTDAPSHFSRVVEGIGMLSAIADGTFEFTSRPAPDVAEPPIEVPAIAAAMEKDALREKRLADLGIDPGEGLSMKRHIADAMSIKPAVWQLLADLVDPFSLDSIQSRMGRRKAVATLLTLDALGVLDRRGEPLITESTIVERTSVGDLDAAGETPDEPVEVEIDGAQHHDVESPLSGERLEVPAPAETLPESENPWLSAGAVSQENTSKSASEARLDEPVVEIFGLDAPSGAAAVDREMHEVVAPSDTTLVSDVLGDMRSRFRQREYFYDDEED